MTHVTRTLILLCFHVICTTATHETTSPTTPLPSSPTPDPWRCCDLDRASTPCYRCCTPGLHVTAVYDMGYHFYCKPQGPLSCWKKGGVIINTTTSGYRHLRSDATCCGGSFMQLRYLQKVRLFGRYYFQHVSITCV